jgi:probable H4MPT-linked C1 transfer pathway protein
MNHPNKPARNAWIGLDVGGANLKAAHSDGPVLSVPFEVWKRPGDLAAAIASVATSLPTASAVALTMTAELCDCYPTRRVGVEAVLDAVSRALPDRSLSIWGVDGDFHAVEDVRDRPMIAAAANWRALAELAARLVPNGTAILIDIGSTTTDLSPLSHGAVAVRGRTDTERLQTGELIYAGARRTPIHALARELPFRGVPTGLAAELFATTLDVYLVLGDIDPNPADLSTADGRPATVDAARDRLARMVCADRQVFSPEDARDFAHAVDRGLTKRLVRAANGACRATIGHPAAAVIAGSGTFLATRVARQVIRDGGSIVQLSEVWGPAASAAGCAYAVVRLAVERLGVAGR